MNQTRRPIYDTTKETQSDTDQPSSSRSKHPVGNHHRSTPQRFPYSSINGDDEVKYLHNPWLHSLSQSQEGLFAYINSTFTWVESYSNQAIDHVSATKQSHESLFANNSIYPPIIKKKAEYIIDPSMPWQALFHLFAMGQLSLDIRFHTQNVHFPFSPLVTFLLVYPSPSGSISFPSPDGHSGLLRKPTLPGLIFSLQWERALVLLHYSSHSWKRHLIISSALFMCIS